MKVLLVDDDPAILEVLGAFLRGAGFEVLEAEDGEKALELFPQADLVILDLMLPKVGGLEVARLIRQERPELPLLILTAKGEEEDRVLGLELGADDYPSPSTRGWFYAGRGFLKGSGCPAFPGWTG